MDTPRSPKTESKVLIKRAQNEFFKKNYSGCLDLLNSVDSFVGLEEKIIHNKLIAEFYKNGLKSVNDIRKKFEKMVKDPKPELAYLHYNYALILYHQHQYKKALNILKPLQRMLDSDHNDEILCVYTSLLTLTILLSHKDHKQAKSMMISTQNPSGKKYVASNIFQDDSPHWSFKDMWQLTCDRVDVLNKAEIKLALKPDSSEYSVLRAHQHFLKHDIQMAAKELSKKFSSDTFSMSTNGEIQDTVLANNMGLIHFSVRHYAIAVQFFQCALNFDSIASENVLNNPTLVEMSACRRPDILYNLGISMLFLERPQEAFDCLLVPLNYHHNNPRLWLRLAEACIMVHKANLKKASNNLITTGVIGSGMLRKFILKPTNPKYKTNLSDSYAIPNPNLEFATLCLSNALILVTNMEGRFRNGKTGTVPSLPSNPMRQYMVGKLKATILANLSYSCLQLGDFTSSLKYGMELLELKECPSSLRFIGSMYCAESLVMLDRPHTTQLYMNPMALKDLTSHDLERHVSPGWTCTSLELAKAIFYYNGAVCLVMNDGHKNAGRLLAQSYHPDIMNPVMKLKVYLDYYFKSSDLALNLSLIEEKCLK